LNIGGGLGGLLGCVGVSMPLSALAILNEFAIDLSRFSSKMGFSKLMMYQYGSRKKMQITPTTPPTTIPTAELFVINQHAFYFIV